MKHKKGVFISILLLVTIVLTSCEVDIPETYVQITNERGIRPWAYDTLNNGSLYEVILICYINEDVAEQISVDPIYSGGGISEKVFISNRIDKIKISFTSLPKESEYYNILGLERIWFREFFPIEMGVLNEIKINYENVFVDFPE